MDETFEIPVSHQNNELSFPARLLAYGYSYKIEVTINGTNVMFEPDEERKWRALISYEDLASNKAFTVDLLQAIASSLDEILK